MKKKLEDVFVGKRFNRWTVKSEIFYKTFPGGSKAKFVDCECGTKAEVRLAALTSPRDVGNHNKGKSKGTSQYKGVYYDKARDKWTARCNRNGVIYLQKRYETELEAAIAYDNCSEEIYGDRPNHTTRDALP